jgi:twitching motility protein PilT
MGSNLRTQESVRLGEAEGRSSYEIIEASYPFGWRTFDHAALEAFEHGFVSEDAALLYCTKRDVVNRGIDRLRKMRGEMTSSIGELRMQAVTAPKPTTSKAAPKVVFKLK